MTNIKVKISGASAEATADGKLTSGMVGIPVTVEYDESWKDLAKNISFKADGFQRTVKDVGNPVVVPWEVMRNPNKTLFVGVEGRNADGSIVIPTIWAIVGKIELGAEKCIPASCKLPDSSHDKDCVKTVNGKTPDQNGNVEIEVSGGNVDQEQITIAINTALAQAKAGGEFDGKDGTSATHSWNGTVLTVTSASGASSANLKGEKGDKGDVGTPAMLTNAEVRYQVSESGTVAPSGVWSESVPVVPQGKYLWTRIVQTFNTGGPITAYTVSRMGIDGLGSVASVCGVSPDPDGNVPLTAEAIGARPDTWTPNATDTGAVVGSEDVDNPGCYYRTVNGETEWLNPPAVLGVEYRTAERWLGKPVYTKLLEVGYAANGKAVAHGAGSVGILRCAGLLSNIPLPINQNSNCYAYLDVSWNNVTLYEAGYDNSYVVAQLWYIK